jgi:hypothetical protein
LRIFHELALSKLSALIIRFSESLPPVFLTFKAHLTQNKDIG